MSLNIDMKIIRPWNCSGSPILFMNCWPSWTNCNAVNPWKIFHSNSIGSPSILSKILYCDELLNHINLSSQAEFDCGFQCIFPRHDTESENTYTFAYERLMTSSSLTRDNCFHEELSQLIWDTPKSHPIVPISTVQISRTSALKWDLSLYFCWHVNFLSNSFAWIQMLPRSKT